MRLHSLTLTAIGPFPGTQEVDFASLSAGGMFLLEGPTGAGKSTIIDAAVFALYGRTASTDTSQDRLVSRHATPGTVPVVDLVFETAAGVHRVRRSPEHLRPKQRGSGYVKEHAQVRLWRLADPSDAEGCLLSTRVGEADAELLRIVGLSREQFVQTVVLPQGEFSTFLRAAPEERRAVLQRLFGTEIYQRMQERLAESARLARREAETAKAGARSATEAFVRAATITPGDAPVAGETDTTGGVGAPADARDAGLVPDETDIVAALLAQVHDLCEEPEEEKLNALAEEVVGAFDARASSLAETERQARGQERTARHRYEAALRLSELLARRALLLSERAELEARRDELADAERRLDAARRAAGTLPLVRASAGARDDVGRADEVLRELRAEASGGADADLADPTADLSAVLAQVQRDLGTVDPVVELEARLPELASEAALAHDVVVRGAAAIDRVLADLASRPADRAGLEDGLGRLRAKAVRVEALQARLDLAGSRLRAAQDVARLAAEEVGCRALLTERATTAAAQIERLGELRRRRIADIAGELAENLVTGEACPVCGSAVHPSPASRPAGAVDAASIEDAEASCERAEELLREAAHLTSDVGARRRAAEAASDGRSTESAADDVHTLLAELAEAVTASEALRKAERDLSRFDTQTEERRSELTRLQDEQTSAHQRWTLLEEDATRAARILSEARGSWPSIAARVDALGARADRAARLEEARRRLAAAEAHEREQAEVLAFALGATSFASVDEALAAALKPEQVRRLERVVAEHEAARIRVHSGLADRAIAALTGEERADVARAERGRDQASAAHVAAARSAERARGHLAAVRQALEVLQTALSTYSAAARTAEPIKRIAELVTAGDANDRHHTLASHVLLRRFEEVLEAANVRLASMSDGRYALARTDEREGGVSARRTGLGLVVDDLLVGHRRATRTLSGGETFYVSLSLALGLADVVRAEAGGIDLETLFVDEGFGSLDPDTLDTVLRELGRLGSGGRVVGIVSHVAELKHRIAERIEVRRRTDGSSTLAVVA